MKKIIHLVVFLGVLSAIAGGLLSYVNGLTAPVIQENALAAEKASLQELFPDTDEFAKLEFTDETGIVENVYDAGEAGFAFKCSNIGFNTSTPIQMIIALDNEGTTIGFQVVSHQETAGLGDVIETEGFNENVVGRTIDEDIDLVSGATYSSTAVREAIQAAKAVFTQITGVASTDQLTLSVSGEVNHE